MNRNKSYEDDDDNPLDRNKTKWTDLKRNLHTREGGVSHRDYMDVSLLPTPGDVGGGGWRRFAWRKPKSGRYKTKYKTMDIPFALDLLRRMKGGKGKRATKAARVVSRLLREPSLRVSDADRKRISRSGASLRAWRRIALALADMKAKRKKKRTTA